MNLATHILKKDIRRSWVILSLWLLLVMLQCMLVGSGINSGDHVVQALYSMITVLVPLFQMLALIVIIPQVVQEEPLVGTTAFWFSRPISRPTLLKSKALFAVVVLVLPPLVAEVIVLAANGATGHDLALAVPEIAMENITIVLYIAVLAVLTQNFGRFAVLASVVVVAMILIQVAVVWTTIFLNPERMLNEARNFSLSKSGSVAASLLTIVAIGAVVAHQYLTRNTRRTIAGAVVSMALILAVQHFWPWDFLKPGKVMAGGANFDAGAVKTSLGSNVNASDVMTMRGQGVPQKNILSDIDTQGIPKGYVVEISSVHPHLNFPDGRPLDAKTAPPAFFSNETNVDAVEFALGGTPVINSYNSSDTRNTFLFILDGETFSKYKAQPLEFSTGLDLVVSRYIVTAEMPLVKGSRYDHGSEHVVITDVLGQPAGVDIMLRQRKLHLLFDLNEDQNPPQITAGGKVVYVLLNKKRREAFLQKQASSFNVNLQVGSQRLRNEPLQISFGAEQNSSRLISDVTPEWLADAVLVRLELAPVATFSKELTVKNFLLSGNMPSVSRRDSTERADVEALRKITLPENATKEQAKEYINEVMVASRKQNVFGNNDPQIGMLEKVGPENLDVLIDFAGRLGSGGQRTYITDAIQRLARPDDKALILQALAQDRDLVSLVVKCGWQTDVRYTLVAGLEKEKEYLPVDWIKAVASLQDPSTYPALKAYFIEGNNKQQTFDAIKQLPGLDLPGAVSEMWAKARYKSEHEMLDVSGIAAEYGHVDVLESAAGVLKKEKNKYELNRARAIVTKFTPATGDDAALIAWLQSNRDKLVFDPQSKKFVPQK